MFVKLTDKNGNVFRSFVNEIDKPVDEFDADPEIREMIEQSKIDIKKGHVYSTQQMIDMIRSGEI